MSTTLRGFIDQHGITAEVEWADDNPNMPDAMPGSSHYRVTLRNERGSLVVPFTMGPALTDEPDVKTVLDCIASGVPKDDEWRSAAPFMEGTAATLDRGCVERPEHYEED